MFLEVTLLRNVFASWSRLAITILIQLFTVPILLTNWNSDELGAWLVLQAFVALTCLADQCYHSYLENEFIKVYNVSVESFGSLLRQAFKTSRILSFLQLVIVVYILYYGTISRAYGFSLIKIHSGDSIEIIVLLSCLNWMCFGNRVSVLSKALIACGKFEIVTWWGIAYQLISTLAYCTASFLGGSVFETGVVFVTTQFAINIAALHYLRKKLPNKFGVANEASNGINISHHSRALISAFQVATEALKLQGVRLIIGINDGLGDIATFNSMRTISNCGAQMLTVLTSPLTPHYSQYIAKRDIGNFHKVFHSTNLFSLLAISPVSIFVAGNGEWLFREWTRGKLEYSPTLLGIFLAGVLTNSFLSTFIMVIKGFNLIWVGFASTLVNLVFIVIGLLTIGRSGSLDGVAMSLFAGDLGSGVVSFVSVLLYLKKFYIDEIIYPFTYVILYGIFSCVGIFLLSTGQSFFDLSLIVVYLMMAATLAVYIYIASVKVRVK